MVMPKASLVKLNFQFQIQFDLNFDSIAFETGLILKLKEMISNSIVTLIVQSFNYRLTSFKGHSSLPILLNDFRTIAVFIPLSFDPNLNPSLGACWCLPQSLEVPLASRG